MTPVGKIVKLLLALTVAGLVALGLQSCKQAPSVGEPEAKAAPAPVTPKNGVVELKVTPDGFEPSPVTLKKGEPVTLKVTRVTDTTCATEINIDEYDIHKALPLNQTVAITFTPNKTGELKYGCSMGKMVSGRFFIE